MTPMSSDKAILTLLCSAVTGHVMFSAFFHHNWVSSQVKQIRYPTKMSCLRFICILNVYSNSLLAIDSNWEGKKKARYRCLMCSTCLHPHHLPFPCFLTCTEKPLWPALRHLGCMSLSSHQSQAAVPVSLSRVKGTHLSAAVPCAHLWPRHISAVFANDL